MDLNIRKLERDAASGNIYAKQKLNRYRNRIMAGPYSHLIEQQVLFVDDYSHYCGKILRQFETQNGYLFHVEPCYQISLFGENGPENKTRIDNGPVVLNSERFKIIQKMPENWKLD